MAVVTETTLQTAGFKGLNREITICGTVTLHKTWAVFFKCFISDLRNGSVTNDKLPLLREPDFHLLRLAVELELILSKNYHSNCKDHSC